MFGRGGGGGYNYEAHWEYVNGIKISLMTASILSSLFQRHNCNRIIISFCFIEFLLLLYATKVKDLCTIVKIIKKF